MLILREGSIVTVMLLQVMSVESLSDPDHSQWFVPESAIGWLHIWPL